MRGFALPIPKRVRIALSALESTRYALIIGQSRFWPTKIALSLASRAHGVRERGETAKIVAFSVRFNLRGPFSVRFRPTDANRRVCANLAVERKVALIFTARRFAKVRQAVIGATPIYVVNLIARPVSMGHRPRNAVRVNAHRNTTRRGYDATQITIRKLGRERRLSRPSRAPVLRHVDVIAPRQSAAFWIVFQTLAQIGRRHE